MTTYGLIGFPLSHSFSKKYFLNKFVSENLQGYDYENFEIRSIEEVPYLIESKKNLAGFNVTIPYKIAVLKFLDEITHEAEEIGAVNTVRIDRNENGKNYYLKGFNTDIIGFEKSIQPLLKPHHQKALVLGTGGASRAVRYVLNRLKIAFKFVSREKKNNNTICYSDINEDVLEENTIIINTTPLGKLPDLTLPPLPYPFLNSRHLLYDLNYNPEISPFLQQGLTHHCIIKNGMEMLKKQAEASWSIWTGA